MEEMEEQDIFLPNKEEIKTRYALYNPYFHEILSNVEGKLKRIIALPSLPTYKTRVKSFNSYYKKILRKRSEEARTSSTLVTLTDMIGIRVICPFMEDLDSVEQQIVENFDVKEIERKGEDQSIREFGYKSVHILVAIPEDCKSNDPSYPQLPDDLVCEIQVRTILQDAWAEVEHELIYKSEFNPFDVPLRRKLASINASLSLADIIFQEIRDYQNKLQNELGTRRNTFYDRADELTEEEFGLRRDNSRSSLNNLTASHSGRSNISIDDLVLMALQEHNSGNFEKATEIYTRILESKPEPSAVVMSVIYKHRGMAYFAQSEYEKALEDFKSSVEKDGKSFRSLYYEGIVYSVQGRDREAIECFNASLAIDSFQSHVYYRRSLAYYNLGEYNKSFKDLDSAVSLGLNDDDVKALKAKLIKKFDMNM